VRGRQLGVVMAVVAVCRSCGQTYYTLQDRHEQRTRAFNAAPLRNCALISLSFIARCVFLVSGAQCHPVHHQELRGVQAPVQQVRLPLEAGPAPNPTGGSNHQTMPIPRLL
jgi:hypothetical protein